MRQPLADRLLGRCRLTHAGYETPCWVWLGALAGEGYGGIRLEGRRHAVHRVAYQLAVGPIPEGLTLDHLCRNRTCVNPGHLEVVTLRENILRGTSPSARNAAKSHCIHGHEFTVANTYRKANGERQCRTCTLEKNREYYARNRDVIRAKQNRRQREARRNAADDALSDAQLDDQQPLDKATPFGVPAGRE